MPLKPIYEKSPLVALTSLPLRPGMARAQLPMMERLYALASREAEVPALWEGLFRLACILKSAPKEESVYSLVMAAVDHQAEDGGLPRELPEALAVMRAAWAVYEHEAQRNLLEKLALWCGWLHEHWTDAMACAALRTRSADLMELLENLYRVTGKKAIAALCDRLRQQAMDWSGILHTFAVQRPMSRITPWKDMEAGLEAEGGDEAGFYTRQYLACHGEALADGARASMASGRFSGNGRELSAVKAGWEKISRYHGAVCGGVTADVTLGGASPSVGVDAASLGAWAEAFAVCGTEEEAWAFQAAETLWYNALPAALDADALVPFQRVNSLAAQCGVKDCYHACEDREQLLHALSRLLRGCAALFSSAVTLKPQGININLCLPGRFMLPLRGGSCAMTVTGDNGQYTLAFAMKKPVRAAVSVRVPTWAADVCLTVNNEDGHAGRPGAYVTIDRTWQDGDVLRLSFTQELRVTEGHHQSALIRLGAQVMAYAPKDGCWAMALCGEPRLQDGKVIAPLRHVPEWRKKGNVPMDLPVLPDTEGEIVHAELVPYAQTLCRIALFPRGREA